LSFIAFNFYSANIGRLSRFSLLCLIRFRRLKLMMSGGKIPLWVVGTIAGLGAIGIVALFFYGAYAGLGSSI